ncbi:MAG TPA: EamA family transporter [Stellaceae bacterium]|nr:EamA family transporter [Stellaceae bacterium]
MPTSLAYISLAAAVLLGIAGQIVLKSGAVGAPSLIAQFLNPLTIAGLAIYCLAAIAYISSLNRLPVSVAFPSVAASYVIVAILAHYLWNEPLGWPQFAGIVLIAGGIFLIHQT